MERPKINTYLITHGLATNWGFESSFKSQCFLSYVECPVM